MVKKKNNHLNVIWSKSAYLSLEKRCKYIGKNSPKNAERVKSDIIGTTLELGLNPEKFPIDKYKLANSGNYRAFEKFRIRISYKYSDVEVRILRVRSTDQAPRLY